jgi:hypothetical protein
MRDFIREICFMHLRAPLLRPIIVLTYGDEIVTAVPDMAVGPTVTQAREENIHKGGMRYGPDTMGR